ncbi:MAG: M15 family metallopeptidase [Bacilli bacterium]|nr:M15 family metallopeptidase [Bacilli bacterium]
MKKLKKNRIVILIAIVLIAVVIIINPIKLINKNKLSNLKYKENTIENIFKYKLAEKVIEIGYSKTLESALNSKDFEKKNINSYEKIDYVEQDDFVKNINSLLEKEYSIDEINHINKTATKEDVDYILTLEKEDVSKYLSIDYSKASKFKRYIEYASNNVLTKEEIVTYINIGLDNDFYKEYNDVTDFNNTMLVNKYNKLPDDYVPENLTTIDSEYATNENQSATKEVVDAFIKMADDMKEENLHIIANSSYRDYQSQKDIYESYEKKYGGKYAMEYAALAGFSEHQTGLVIDIANKNHDIFSGTKEYQWLKKNSYKYGFILRYPKNKDNITGYAYEAWHYRYVGVELATKVFESELTYDEYYVKYLDN